MVDGNSYVYFNTTPKFKIKSTYPFTSPQWKESWRKPSRLWAALWEPERSQGWKSAGAAPSSPVQTNWLRHPVIPWPGEAYSSHTGRSPWAEGSHSGSVTLQAKGPQLPSFPHCYLMSTAHLRVLGYCLLHWHVSSLAGALSCPCLQPST